MKPVLIWIYDWPLRGYGAFVGACLVVGMTLVMRYGRRNGLPVQGLLDAAFASVIGGIVGSRLMYVVVHYRDLASPLEALKVWEGGMMYFGGLLLGMFVGVFVALRRGLSLWPAVDTVAPALGAGQAIGRVACLIAGCCYGMEMKGPWSIQFPPSDFSSVPASLWGVPLLPAQVLQIAEGLFLWALGVWAFKRKRFDGQPFILVMGTAGVTRFLIEGLRDDDARGFFFQEQFGHTFSSSRVLGLAMIAGAAAAYLLRTLQYSAPRADVAPAMPAEATIEKA